MKAIVSSWKIASQKSRYLLFETVHLERHQQRFFTLNMHQNRWRLGLHPRPQCGSLQRCSGCPDPQAGFRRLLLRGKGKWERGRENRRKGEVTRGEGRDFGPSQCWKQIDVSDSLQRPMHLYYFELWSYVAQSQNLGWPLWPRLHIIVVHIH